MSFYSRYKGRSMGRLLHFLYYYCPLRIVEVVQFETGTPGDDSTGEMSLYGKPFLNYKFDENDYPTFTFVGEYAADYAAAQTRRRDEAIAELAP